MSKTYKLEKNVIEELYWRDVKTGDVIIVHKDERICADLILLSTSTPDGVSFLETSTLDGEKHLKPRTCLKETLASVVQNNETYHDESSQGIDMDVELVASVQKPSPSLYHFEGFVNFIQNEKKVERSVPVGVENFLFKGAMIRNVDWVVGLVVYTGKDTKIQQNGAKARFKISNVEKRMQVMIVVLFVAQLLMSFAAIIIKAIKDTAFTTHFDEYLIDEGAEDEGNFFLIFIRYFILLSTLIPIGLIVNLEMVRLIQAYFMSSNLDLKNKALGR